MPDVTPESTPEAGTPEAQAAARAAQRTVHQNGAFVSVFVITAITIVFFLAIFFAFPGSSGSQKTGQVDSVGASLRDQDSLDAVALGRYNAVRDTGGAVQGYTMPIDSAIMQEARATGGAAAPDSVLPLR